MKRTYPAIALVAMTTLISELLLTRVFDVILQPNMAYLVITLALFAFGIAGVIGAIWPLPTGVDPGKRVAGLTAGFGLSILALRPAMNLLPFDHEMLAVQPFVQLGAFAGMYMALAIPFFLAGLVFATLFSAYSKDIRRLYCWDLVGAGIGCVVIIPFLPAIAPGGELMVAAGLAFVAAALFAGGARWLVIGVSAAVVCTALPVLKSPEYFIFQEHAAKRGVKEARQAGLVELTRWDPVSKIDIIDDAPTDASVRTKHVAYDGGQQSSLLYEFDGDFDALRVALMSGEASAEDHFWFADVLAAHLLKSDSDQKVLILGSAGGQETKAALTFGASRVDAVELVGAVVDLVTGPYSHFIGNIFLDPRVNTIAAEGRSFLRASRERYDIIQIFSNHTSSSVASGSGAAQTTYLQTADAYREVFTHLADDGILQVNQRAYPRLITTAALAWRQLGRSDFKRHVLVTQRLGMLDTIPTLLISMSPWTEAKVETIRNLHKLFPGGRKVRTIVENPLDQEESFLSADFYSGQFPKELARRMAYRAEPTTDDQPYFKYLRKEFGHFEADPNRFLDENNARLLNEMTRRGVPMDIAHFVITAIASLVMSSVFVFAPLRFSPAGKARWPGRTPALVYFSCLGAGFIIIELVFIQIFMKLIGSPLYAYSLVIFTMLLAAGLGSLSSDRLAVDPHKRWYLPFVAVVAYGALFTVLYPGIFEIALASDLGVRIAVSFVLIFPLGFFLGMPFPLGIVTIAEGPRGAVAWAWAMNGLFTVVGGLATVVLSIYLGFRFTIGVGLAVYVVALLSLTRMRQDSLAISARVSVD